jgi:hypothetical protein
MFMGSESLTSGGFTNIILFSYVTYSPSTIPNSTNLINSMHMGKLTTTGMLTQ